MQDYIEQRAVNVHVAVVLDEAELAELVHEEADARPCGPHHFRQGFLADIGDHRLGLTVFPEVGQQEQHPRQSLFARIEQLIH